ncbi:dTMP kinase [Allosphingosinicella sp.]|uniref:dTMP kinase n=1 Tax=Allosphingosinicella sp. TaxID=2823234 RepID=UPI003D72F540
MKPVSSTASWRASIISSAEVKRGRFISLEGGEGVGKSTQLKRLAEALRARGLDVVETREPGGSPGAEAIRKLLLEGEAERWTAETEALLFAAARADHVARTIRPALERGAWVLTDRFLDSSLAYQGGAGGVGTDAIRQLHAIGSAGLLPDRTIILHLPADAAAGRAATRDGGAADRIGGRGADYHGLVALAFRSLAEKEPGRFRVIDAAGAPEHVTDRILATLDDLL